LSALVRYRVSSLDGRVGTEADRQRAEQLALEVQGVGSVVPFSGSASK
jgi:osmotically-inducible protein OsmY